MNPYLYYQAKYDGCDERGYIRIELSYIGGTEDECPTRMGVEYYGVRGFDRSARPCFHYVEEALDSDFVYMPGLSDLLGNPELGSWNAPDAVDRFLWALCTTCHGMRLKSLAEPIFNPEIYPPTTSENDD